MDATPEQTPPPPHAPVLAGLGVGPGEERVYRALLAAPGSTLGALARATGLTDESVDGHVRSLTDLGLLTGAADGTERLTPAPPDVAPEGVTVVAAFHTVGAPELADREGRSEENNQRDPVFIVSYCQRVERWKKKEVETKQSQH